jgi:hypothetical protein|tara:strand:+ start:129 stop:476 length:348 start_codon:yes stop_codon:yes gene_type:complete
LSRKNSKSRIISHKTIIGKIKRLENLARDYGIVSSLYYYPFPDGFFSYLIRMINYDSENSQAQITELGRGFASPFESPGNLEKVILEYLLLTKGRIKLKSKHLEQLGPPICLWLF